jgi:tetratricopeptide (TPR) repeat protein
MWVLYWMGDTPESGRLIERVRPFIAVHGSAEQRANFFTNITMMALRRDRFLVADKTLGFARAAYAAAQEAESPYVGPVWPVFTLGFTLFWRGDLDEATEMLRDSLQEAERRGDATIRSRSLTYLMAAMRKRGDLDGVRKAIGPVIEWAREASLPEYEAMALANRAWAEWRAGEDENAATDALTALEMWEGLPVRYPVDWMALWPLIALALAFQRTGQAVEYARRMLHPPQQLLQEPVPTLVGKAVHAWDEDQSTEAEELLRGAMRAAGDLGYL